MNGQPTEIQEQFYDMTIEGLEAIARHAEAAVTALTEGEFESAIAIMTQGSFLSPDEGTVWETLLRWVRKCKEISDQLEEENA